LANGNNLNSDVSASEIISPTIQNNSDSIKPKKAILNLTLEDLFNPNKFTLNLDHDGNERKQKITKNDFMKVSNLSSSLNDTGKDGNVKQNDPFFSLDPLRKQ